MDSLGLREGVSASARLVTSKCQEMLVLYSRYDHMEFIPFIPSDTIDDLMANVFNALITYGSPVEPTKGASIELSGVTLELRHPRARLSQSVVRGRVFSPLGEFCWYLSGSDHVDFIEYYIPDYRQYSDDPEAHPCVTNGAYGPRIFGNETKKQFDTVKDLLSKKPSSRQAVIQIFDREDIAEAHKDVPCTCILQFMVRDDKLNLIVYMRSNDAFKGLPHDIFSFTMMQEIMSRSLNFELGTYKHIVGSLHLYDSDRKKAESYLDEGFFATLGAEMPPMPVGNPEESLRNFLVAEEQIRTKKAITEQTGELDPYWLDLVRLLQIYPLQKQKEWEKMEQIFSLMSNPFYSPFIVHKRPDEN